MSKIRENICKVLIGIFLFTVFIFIIVEVVPRHRIARNGIDITTESCNWMSKIDDEVSLSSICVPGLHDAATNNVRLALFTKCQDKSVETLLMEGYRYLDIRLGVDADNDTDKLAIYHGFVKCLEGNSVFNSTLYLDSVLKECYDFLSENPSETIIFVVKKEYGDETITEFENLLLKYSGEGQYSDKWLLTDKIPTLGQSRGKIVLFRRYADEAKLGEKSGIPLIWRSQEEEEISDIPYEREEQNDIFYVQDHFNYVIEDKWQAFVDTANEAEELSKDGTVVNFLSTSGRLKYSNPYWFAKKLNKRFIAEYNEKKISGWVVMDYGTREMAEIVYSTNF